MTIVTPGELQVSVRSQGRAAKVSGQSLAEFALIVPVLLVMLLGILEFGRASYAHAAITFAAREAARFGVMNPGNIVGIKQHAVVAAPALDLSPDDVTVTLPGGTGRDKPIRVEITYGFQFLVPLVGDQVILYTSSTMHIE